LRDRELHLRPYTTLFRSTAYWKPPAVFLVGARRFELPTPCAQGRCATRLRYAPSIDQSHSTWAMPEIKVLRSNRLAMSAFLPVRSEEYTYEIQSPAHLLC